MLSVNIVTIDCYQSSPVPDLDVTFSEFRGAEIRRVPVIRIFGATSAGKKTCLHVHGVFPYIYVPCTTEENADIFAYRLAASIDSALNTSFGRSTSNTQHVYKIQRVSGIPFYGYHEKEHLFFKIYFYNPALIKRAADLLQNGTILNQSLQPHEAHIPYILQFMIDYNLYGMSTINLRNVKYRREVYSASSEPSQNESFVDLNSQKYLPPSVAKQSMCELEIDTRASDILNIEAIMKGLQELNPGLAAIWEEERVRREEAGLQKSNSQFLFPQSPNDITLPPTDNDVYQEQRLAQRLQTISQKEEEISSGSTLASTYPLEIHDKTDILNASHVLNHTEDNEIAEKFVPNETIEFELHSTTLQQRDSDSTILDAEDAQLLGLLANLAEANDTDTEVDNDSVLGSQYSALNEEIKNDNEEEDLEDLNITCLDLDSLSSWGSIKATSQSSVSISKASQDKKDKEINFDEILSPNIPQVDGADDVSPGPSSLNSKKHITKQISKFEQKEKISKEYQMDHQDLDVYDISDIEELTLKSMENSIIHDNTSQLHEKRENLSIQSKIPAVDGDVNASSNGSEPDADVTIEKQEILVCAYKSARKKSVQDTVDTPKKRKRNLEEDDCDSPSKRKNINLSSPQCPSRSYQPLNIIVTSPKSPATPSRRKSELRLSLFKEKRMSLRKNYDERNIETNSDTVSELTVDNVLNKDKESKKIVEVSNSKDVRKKLDFCTFDESASDVSTISVESGNEQEDTTLTEDKLDQPNAENVVCSSINKNPEENISANAVGVQVGEDKDNKKNNEEIESVNEETDVSETKPDDLETTLINENIPEIDSENEDVCNTTFTQYISKRLEMNSQSSLLTSVASGSTKIITIVPKFNPPDRNRIANTMQLYGIPQCRQVMPFFSNKVDHIKHKESADKNFNGIPDIAPFRSSLERVTGIKLWRRMKVNEFYPSGASIKSSHIKRTLAGYNLLTIRPLVSPPSVQDVKNWLKAKKYLLKKELKHERAKKEKDENKVPKTANKEIGLNETKTDNKKRDINEKTSTSLLDQTKSDEQKCSQNSNDSYNSSTDSLNPSLQKALKNPLLYKKPESQHLEVSYGQIECATKSSNGSVTKENFQNARAVTVHRYVTLISLEIHVSTRGDLLPDPQQDPIEALFYATQADITVSSDISQIEHGAIIVNHINNERLGNIYSSITTCPVVHVANEVELLNSFINLITKYDPDILLGWELESLSLGYIFQRAACINFNNLPLRISKIPHVKSSPEAQAEKDDTGEVKVPGRIILDVWRIMRHEVALLIYTFENVMYNVMRERISCPTFKTLTDWWRQENIAVKCRVIEHYVIRVLGTLKILSHLDIIGRTCELARLFGIQFYEVFSRGSQFRVESIMLRLAKPLNYIAVSPSMHQRARMRAPEALPLIMEPESTLYTDPLIVLDFQSLYPSIIIAYNYCFSTCLGRIEHIGQYEPFEFGASHLRVRKRTALKLQGNINFSPCGVAFVKSEVRRGVLPRMLAEILNTRLMVKESMKLHPAENRTLQRVLDSQQLGLKLIANVTYGYTSANFSGRMPCIEVGDSVVSKGRETLERAIKIVESTPKWGAQVVYGDTDSIFILLPGKSRKEAFEIGAEIADTVTAANPPPVKLKFEKVLYPSILQTKKRYCGYMYETPAQEKPEYLAKGIETVRRDGCPAVSKILEKCLKILFDTKDISLVKRYVTRQFDKILRRKVSVQDLTFAKEFRGLRGYKANACVPALELTRRLIRKDPRAIPRVGERVRYVIVAGAPNQALIQCVRTPMELISDPGLNPNSIYYITKVIIPPLNRCFSLIGIDVNTWYREMSHRQYFDTAANLATENPKSTIYQFFSTVACVTCDEQTNNEVCAKCMRRPDRTIIILQEKLRWLERTHYQVNAICQSCVGRLDNPNCESLDCPVLYRVAQTRRDLLKISYLNDIINNRSNTTEITTSGPTIVTT